MKILLYKERLQPSPPPAVLEAARAIGEEANVILTHAAARRLIPLIPHILIPIHEMKASQITTFLWSAMRVESSIIDMEEFHIYVQQSLESAISHNLLERQGDCYTITTEGVQAALQFTIKLHQNGYIS